MAAPDAEDGSYRWNTLDLATRLVVEAGPALPLTAELADRIHEADGVLDAAEFLAGRDSPAYHLLTEDIAWIRALRNK